MGSERKMNDELSLRDALPSVAQLRKQVEVWDQVFDRIKPRRETMSSVTPSAQQIDRAARLLAIAGQLRADEDAALRKRGHVPADPNYGLTKNEIAAAEMMNGLMAINAGLINALRDILANDGGKGSEGYHAGRLHDAREAGFRALAKAEAGWNGGVGEIIEGCNGPAALVRELRRVTPDRCEEASVRIAELCQEAAREIEALDEAYRAADRIACREKERADRE